MITSARPPARALLRAWSSRTRIRPIACAVLAASTVAGCESPKHFTTTMEVLQVEAFKDDKGETTKLGLELRYADCPGDARRILRADKAFAKCAGTIEPGDKLKA